MTKCCVPRPSVRTRTRPEGERSTMTSECFVYVMLPGQTEFVTAGRFALGEDRRGVPVGRFIYGRRYLERPDAVPIDPIELPLSARTYETTRLKGVFGAIRDASPDYWGRRVIEKHAGLAVLSEIDYLRQSPDDRAGARGFGLNVQPPAPLRKFNRTMDLERLQRLADLIIADEEAPEEQPGNGEARGTALRSRTFCSSGPPWAVRVPRRSSRTAGSSGSRSSTGQTTGGTRRASSTPCWPSRTSADCTSRSRVSCRWVTAMPCS